MFLTQLRAILRAAAHGQVNLLIPMLAHASEIRQTLSLIDFARAELDNRGVAYGPVKLGAMIEIPAAALTLKIFLKYFDFLSIGTNDLIQYTLAIDRADESVAHLYDPLHPAVLRLVAETIAECNRAGQGRQRVRRDGRRHQPAPACCWAWACAASPCIRRRSSPSSRRCCAPTRRALAPWAQQVLEAEDPAIDAARRPGARLDSLCARVPEHRRADDQRRRQPRCSRSSGRPLTSISSSVEASGVM